MALITEKKVFEIGPITSSISESVTTWQVIKATVIKELTIRFRYKANLVGMFIEMIVFISMFGLFATAAQFRDLGLNQREMFIFFLVGILIMVFSDAALWIPMNAVKTDLYNGTLEFIYSNPSNRFAYFAGTVVAGAIFRQIFVIPMLIILLLVSGTSVLNMGSMILVLLLVTLVILSFGILIGMMTVLWKETESIAGILQIFFQFIAGGFFPVQSLPVFAQWIAYALPYTYGYDLMRYYAFGGPSGSWVTYVPVWINWLALVGYAVLYYFITVYLLRRVENKSKKNGLHLI
ncbi:MAG: ABC transporter permease [Candidatus Kariarchaeaceae archaeon]|jgi:ABC-2 type transport system permease protein